MSPIYWLLGDGLDFFIVTRSIQILDIAADTEYGPLMMGIMMLVSTTGF